MSFLSELLGEAYKENMTEEEISNALKGLSALNGEQEKETNKLKNLISDRNGEIAKLKESLRKKQTDEENKRQEEKDALEKLTKENAELKRSMEIANKKTKLVGMGYEEALADETAIAMVDGDMEKVLLNQSKYLETQKKVIETELLKGTPKPKGNESDNKNKNFDTLIEEARNDGNPALEAYYTRLKAESELQSE